MNNKILNKYFLLKQRSVIHISGEDSSNFLQSIISNDVDKITDKTTIYSALLTPQGRYLFDIFISKKDDAYWLDVGNEYFDDLIKKLKMYRLRSDVEIADLRKEYEIVAGIGDVKINDKAISTALGRTYPFCKGLFFTDPRDKKLGFRAIIERENKYKSFHAKNFEPGDFNDWNQNRIKLNIPDGDFDLVHGKSFPLHFRFNELNAIDYEKGCYVGQEVTTRTHHRGKIRKTTFIINGKNLPKHSTEITLEGKKAGIILSSSGNYALALIDIESTEKSNAFSCGNSTISVIESN